LEFFRFLLGEKKNCTKDKIHFPVHINENLKSDVRKRCILCSYKTSWKCSACSKNANM